MTNVGRKYRSMTYHPLARPHALTHTHTCTGLSLWITSLLSLQQNLIRNLMYEATSNLKGGFEVPVNTPKRGGRTQRGCTQSAEKLRLTCFPLQNPHCGAYLTRRINIFIVLRSRKKKNVKIDKLLRSGQLLKAFNRRHIFHGHN